MPSSKGPTDNRRDAAKERMARAIRDGDDATVTAMIREANDPAERREHARRTLRRFANARTIGELSRAIDLANRLLDRPSADPDDDLAILSRQLLRLVASPEPAPLDVDVLRLAVEASLNDLWLATPERVDRARQRLSAALALPYEPIQRGADQ